MTTWKTTPPAPAKEQSMIECGPVRLHLSDSPCPEAGRTWQHLSLTFGRYSQRTPSDCLDTWPTEAIALARAALDRLEAEIEVQE